MGQWPDGVVGQLLTPLTSYKLGHKTFAIDNGAFSGLREKQFFSMLKRYEHLKEDCLFVAVPDKVGDCVTTLEMWHHFAPMCGDYPKAFVAQDGCKEIPDNAQALFIGGTDLFKESYDAIYLVYLALEMGLHVHIGRVNTFPRFKLYHEIGAHTCDGSGVSRYDHMLPNIRDEFLL